MLTRRGLFGVLAGLVAAPMVAKADFLMPLRGIKVPLDIEIPAWCPSGWVPALGQKVSRFQFPELYKWYEEVQMYIGDGKGNFRLPDTRSNMVYTNGHYSFKPAGPVSVGLVSAIKMVRSNGSVCMPGMFVNFMPPAEIQEQPHSGCEGIHKVQRTAHT